MYANTRIYESCTSRDQQVNGCNYGSPSVSVVIQTRQSRCRWSIDEGSMEYTEISGRNEEEKRYYVTQPHAQQPRQRPRLSALKNT